MQVYRYIIHKPWSKKKFGGKKVTVESSFGFALLRVISFDRFALLPL